MNNTSNNNGPLRAIVSASLLLGCSLIGIALVGCKSAHQPAQSAKPEVLIGTFSSAIDYSPYYVAKSKGWFDQALASQGFTAKYVQFDDLGTMEDYLHKGKVDFIFEAEVPAIVEEASGEKVKIIGLSCTLQQQIVVRTNANIHSIGDLRGKRIAVVTGSSSHYGLLKDLQEAGVPSSSVTIEDLGPADAKLAFENGQVDAWAVWPPFVEQEIVAGLGRVLPGGTANIDSVMTGSSEFATAHPEAAAAMKAVLLKSKTWIIANPQEAQSLVAAQIKVDPKVVALAWPKHVWAATVDQALVSDVNAKAAFLIDIHKIESSVDARSMVEQ